MKHALKFILLAAALLAAFLLPVARAQDATPDGLPADLRYQRGVVGSLDFDAQVASAIPQTIIDGLRAGGWNLVFAWYDPGSYNPRAYDNELPRIAAEGAGHIRIPISMDVLEQGTSGRVRDDRYADLLAFIGRAQGYGLVTIVDIHNTGIRECSGCDWTNDWMWGLTNPTHRARHMALLTDLAGRLGRDADTGWFIIQPGNEPIAEQPWRDYQPQLFASIRQACATCIIFVFAHDWQGVDATLYSLNTSFIDGRTIIDVHEYSPTPLTHCAYPGSPNRCGGLQFPGTFTDWRGTGYWDKARLDSMISPLAAWQAARGVPFIHFSEIGTASALADAPRTAYMCALIDIIQSYGWGFTIYEKLHNFGGYPQGVIDCAFGGGEPSPVTPVTPPTAAPPGPTAVPVTPDPSGYPRAIQTSDSRVTVYETAPPQGNRRTFTVAVDSSINVRRVMLYQGDRWLADDSSPPYTFTLDAAPGQTYSALIVYNARDEFYRADFQFGDAPAVTPTTPGPTPEQPAPTATLPATDVPTVPPTTDFSEAARILREVAQLYEELADILEGEN